MFGLADSDGKIIIPIKYKGLFSIEKDSFYITKNQSNLNGVYDFNGKNVIPEEYKFYTVDNNKIFATKDNEPQIIDILNSKNTIYLDKKSEFIETVRHYSIDESLYQIVKKENKFGVINSRNETLIPLIYDEIKSSQNWRYFIIKQKNKIGLIHVNGAVIKEPVYDNIDSEKNMLY